VASEKTEVIRIQRILAEVRWQAAINIESNLGIKSTCNVVISKANQSLEGSL
jgi:hypothetical protein